MCQKSCHRDDVFVSALIYNGILFGDQSHKLNRIVVRFTACTNLCDRFGVRIDQIFLAIFLEIDLRNGGNNWFNRFSCMYLDMYLQRSSLHTWIEWFDNKMIIASSVWHQNWTDGVRPPSTLSSGMGGEFFSSRSINGSNICCLVSRSVRSSENLFIRSSPNSSTRYSLQQQSNFQKILFNICSTVYYSRKLVEYSPVDILPHSKAIMK